MVASSIFLSGLQSDSSTTIIRKLMSMLRQVQVVTCRTSGKVEAGILTTNEAVICLLQMKSDSVIFPLLGGHPSNIDSFDLERHTDMDSKTSTHSSEPDSPSVARSRSSAQDLDVEGLTLYEKKCILINREIDAFGMGRYQWYIWTLCGFGYLIDLLWAQAFGLVLSPIQQEFGFDSMVCPESPNLKAHISQMLNQGTYPSHFLPD